MNKRLYRILRKLNNTFIRAVPFRGALRPKGLISYADATKERAGSYYPVYADVENRLPIPDELLECLKHESEYSNLDEVDGNDYILKASYLIGDFQDGRILTDNQTFSFVMDAEGRVHEDVSYIFLKHRDDPHRSNSAFSIKCMPAPQRYSGTVFNCLAGGGAINNFSHWLIDVLPRIHLLKQAGLFEQVDYFLMPACYINYHWQTLECIGVPREKVITPGKYITHIAADRIISSSSPRAKKSMLIPQWVSDFIATIPQALSSEDEAPVKLYVTRKDSSKRVVLNEDEVIAALEARGFTMVTLAECDFYQRSKLFQKASVVVSATGAGLANLHFCQPGTQYVEMFTRGFVNSFFYNIAVNCSLKYEYLLFDVPAGQEHGHFQDMLVDVPALLGKLEELGY